MQRGACGAEKRWKREKNCQHVIVLTVFKEKLCMFSILAILQQLHELIS